MRVTIDVSPTAQKHAGLGRYAGEVARALDQATDDLNLSLFYNLQGEAELPDYLRHIPYRTVNVGKLVPSALYEAVAVVLAIAYRRRRKAA